jgi:tetratricopeptide (TPR) repeat protein
VGDYRASLEHNAQAMEIFRALGMTIDLARTLNASVQPHILLGQYEQALAAVEEARAIFQAEGNAWRLARVDANAGNIYHRQDRFPDALASYERACQYFLAHEEQDAEGLAVTLHNMAVCLISMNDFHRALATYQKARDIAERNKMPLLISQADYNIAWLYYLRGEYGQAIEMLRSAREHCRTSGDEYHFALCHMDLSEIYLELNLSRESAQMAQQGAALFEKLKMGYEAAKCQANLGIALGQQGQAFRALEVFTRAREGFVREQNSVWPHLIDLYSALVLFNEGRYFEARRLCLAALEHFRASVLPGKAVLAELLLARLAERTGELETARGSCTAALARAKQLESPILNYQANCLLGEIELASGNPEAA